MRISLLITAFAALAAGCAKGSEMTVDGAAPPDSALAPDAANAPLLGKPCPTAAVEIARIHGADIFPTTVDPAFYVSTNASFYTGDADGDGDADLIVFESAASTSTDHTYRVRLFRYDASTASFEPEIESQIVLPAPGAELDMLADVDGDHRKDLVLGYTTDVPRTPYVYVARQAADGTFALQASRRDVSTCGASNDQRLEAIAVIDVDRDGYDDVVATVSFGGLGSAPAGLSVARGGPAGLGAASCVASSSIVTAGYPARLGSAKLLRVGDFDGDGVPDLVATSYDGSVATMQLYVARGAPDFRAVPGVAVPPASRLLVDHIDGRAGDALLAVDVRTDRTELSRYAIDGQTGIAEATLVATLPTGSAASAYPLLFGFAAADVNGDQLTDVVEIGNQELATGPVPFAITCDRGPRWELAQGSLPEGTRVLRAMRLDRGGGSELVARVGKDIAIFRLDQPR
jgi:hypothetical protein